jgi:hypothetical protein
MKDRQLRSRRFRLGISIGSALAVAFAMHCGTEDSSTFKDGPCATVFKDQCGAPCADDTQCAAGLYCADDKKCFAECAPNTTCADGKACSPNGRCGGGGPIFGGDSGSTTDDDAGPGGDACADIDITLEKVIPTVLLLIDQSGSMTDNQFPPGSGVTRWQVLRSALIDPDGGIVKQLENDVSFGVSLYSWNSGACPQLTNVSWKTGNYTDIFNVYADAGTVNNTPTAESIMGVVGFDDAGVLRDGGFAAATTPGPKIILLATDGDPDSCAAPNSNGTQPPRRFTVWATQRTFDAGIPTYVVSVGTDIDQAHQQEVANAGLGFNPDAGDASAIYRPTDRAQLVAALNKIILGVRSCKFTLNGAVVPGTEGQGVVKLNGAPLGLNDPNGWKLNSSTELEVVGNACTTVQTSPNAQISVRFPCGTVTSVPK